MEKKKERTKERKGSVNDVDDNDDENEDENDGDGEEDNDGNNEEIQAKVRRGRGRMKTGAMCFNEKKNMGQGAKRAEKE